MGRHFSTPPQSFLKIRRAAPRPQLLLGTCSQPHGNALGAGTRRPPTRGATDSTLGTLLSSREHPRSQPCEGGAVTDPFAVQKGPGAEGCRVTCPSSGRWEGSTPGHPPRLLPSRSHF